MRYVHAAEADDKLLELLKYAENGETIIITRHGKPIAHLTPRMKSARGNCEKRLGVNSGEGNLLGRTQR